MKVSELIKKLNVLLESEGDLEVVIEHSPVKDFLDFECGNSSIQKIVDTGWAYGPNIENIVISTIESDE